MTINYNDICIKDVSLRDYQQEGKEKIFNCWNTSDNVLYQMPTGTGKTRLFTSIIRDINVWGLKNKSRRRILIIAHRSELIEQIHRSLEKYHVRHGVIAGIMKDKRDLSLQVQVASIQTITHPSNSFIAKNLDVDFIIIDEAHHAVANSYIKLWRLYPESKKLGVTATPWRMNNSGFKKLFDTFIPSMQIKEFIDKGWLSSYKYYSIPINSKIKKTIDSIKEFDIDGDYKVSALETSMDVDSIRAQLLDSYKKFALGKKGIIYSISRVHSEHICLKYKEIGINIVAIDSETPSKKREMLVNRFREGDIDIIVNVDIFSEGFDCPDIEFIQLARPTKSLVKYIQQVGRGLRKNGNKECVILDNVGLYTSFGLPDEDRDWFYYYEGEDVSPIIQNNSASTHGLYLEPRESNLSEGNEEMVLVQDVVAPQEEKDITIGNNKLNSDSVVENDVENDYVKPFIIRSKSFLNGKYVVEENENGYFLCNTRNNSSVFIGKYKSHTTGSIMVRKTNDDDYMVIRRFPKVKGYKEIIIGYILQEGKIIYYTSFDGVVEKKRITI